MLFNSFEFLFLFLPLFLVGYALCRYIGSWLQGRGHFDNLLYKRYADMLSGLYLIIASLIFYGWQKPVYIPILIGSMAVNYSLAWQMEKCSSSQKQNCKKGYLIIGLLLNIGVLAVFKLFTGAFVPLGISFYTFTQIAFLMECYRGNCKGVKLLEYGQYVTFFPKLLQGPIALPGDLLGKTAQKPDWERYFRSICLFIFGLFKKVLIADTLGKAVDYGYANLGVLNSLDGIIVMLSFTLQLYFDFSGYCDMAMGVSGILGYDLPLNFDSPYKAVNILDFWKRWHITLTKFFTKYLYIPLGGNRKGTWRTVLNCLLVFLVSGIWHGVGWQFLVWGMMHGVLYVITRQWLAYRKEHSLESNIVSIRAKAGLLHGFKRAVGVLLTFLYVNVAWVFFRAPSVKDACSLLKTIGSFRFGRLNWDLADCFNLDEFWYVIKLLRLDSWQDAHYILMVVILLLVLMLVFLGKSAVNYTKTMKPGKLTAAFMAVLFVWSVLSLSGVSTFLYVNF